MPVSFSVAISGGVDSLAGAHFLKTMGYKFKAVHYNHNQRPQNLEMVDGCRKFCDVHGIELVIGTCGTKYNKNVENCLRMERLEFFNDHGGNIITCHHLGDAIESSLMLWVRGKMDCKPIPEISGFDRFTSIRPFIRNHKNTLISWADGHDLSKYLVVDETNLDNTYERNWIRNEILPKIEARRGLSKMILKRFYHEEIMGV